ncbi:MAG TPA: hypothetical protein VGM91_19440 [Conexibacter sp.]|jgi:hypothetical protein
MEVDVEAVAEQAAPEADGRGDFAVGEEPDADGHGVAVEERGGVDRSDAGVELVGVDGVADELGDLEVE